MPKRPTSLHINIPSSSTESMDEFGRYDDNRVMDWEKSRWQFVIPRVEVFDETEKVIVRPDYRPLLRLDGEETSPWNSPEAPPVLLEGLAKEMWEKTTNIYPTKSTVLYIDSEIPTLDTASLTSLVHKLNNRDDVFFVSKSRDFCDIYALVNGHIAAHQGHDGPNATVFEQCRHPYYYDPRVFVYHKIWDILREAKRNDWERLKSADGGPMFHVIDGSPMSLGESLLEPALLLGFICPEQYQTLRTEINSYCKALMSRNNVVRIRIEPCTEDLSNEPLKAKALQEFNEKSGYSWSMTPLLFNNLLNNALITSNYRYGNTRVMTARLDGSDFDKVCSTITMYSQALFNKK